MNLVLLFFYDVIYLIECVNYPYYNEPYPEYHTPCDLIPFVSIDCPFLYCVVAYDSGHQIHHYCACVVCSECYYVLWLTVYA